MAVPLLDLAQQHEPLAGALCEGFEQVLAGGRFILGPRVKTFEQALAAYCHVPQVVGVSSGTDALLAALMALEVGPGDEVITSAFTFFATAGCIARVGAKPVFVDIDLATFNIDVTQIEAVITPAAKAIIPVHMFGQMAQMTAIEAIAHKHGLVVIEDAAQAIGARDGDRAAGSIADVGCFSFYPTKNLSGMGDGGACTIIDAQLADRIRHLRDHGQHPTYFYKIIGGNFRLDALQAMVLDIKLPLLDGWNQSRRRNAERYRQFLDNLPIVLPTEAADKHHTYNQFTIRVPDNKRDMLRDHLIAKQIGCAVYYPLGLHMQECFGYLGYRKGAFPVTELAAQQVLILPIFPGLTLLQQQEVAAAIKAFYT